jgi:methionyl-tRNA formyltransferase
MAAAGARAQLKILLLGGTELTLAIAEHLAATSGIQVAGAVRLEQTFAISYRPSGVVSSRFADIGSWCESHAIPHWLYASTDTIMEAQRATNAEFALVAGWYHMIPARVRSAFRKGCAGIHASLLPKLRGGAPLNWAILSNLDRTGVTLFEMSDGVDDGLVYDQEAFAIPPRATIGDLIEASRIASLVMLTRSLPAIASGTRVPTRQVGEPTYCLQRSPEDSRIDWRLPAEDLDRLVRAVGRPYPGATAMLENAQVTIWRARALEIPSVLGAPGQIAGVPEIGEPVVVTGRGLLAVAEATVQDGSDALALLMKSKNKRFEA